MSNSDREKELACAIVSEKLIDYENSWIVDSGCPNHMISYEKKLFSMTEYKEVAYLANARSLDIRGRIGTEMLSPKTDYAAYLVLKLACKYYGLESTNSIARFLNYESETETDEQANTVQLATLPIMRGDGCMEVELGYFNSKEGSGGPVEARLIKMKRPVDTSGLFVGGIEFRPK
ncbi:hypothetical protein CQW23_29115 [Capsicum baccatum]|uniref:Uncharacterized protein n=1 Tax=Capsicum baccatum TaxID=33114 RepID=A0A2G2VIJ3_CAPBA|nr:hypothetical protein CQW23_29115 [Capsicum baccatum]